MPTSSGFAGTLRRRRKNGSARAPRNDLRGQRHSGSVFKLLIALPICLACGLLFVSGCKRQSPSVPTPAATTTTVESPAQTPVLTPEASDVATGQPLATDNALKSAADNSIASASWVPRGTWTTQRLVALAETGPIVIDVSVSVGNASLREVNDQLLAATTTELFTLMSVSNANAAGREDGPALTAAADTTADANTPSWEQLLELPLIQSGWLGNLVAASEQKLQLIQQYDEDRDEKVSDQELSMFLTRGLERAAPLLVTDIGQMPDRQSDQSPWGSGDRNQDHALDATERDTFGDALAKRDLNADGVITLVEWAEPAGDDPQMNMMTGRRGNSFLRNQTLLVLDDANQADSKKTARKFATDLLRHYTFLAELPRSQWSGWSDELWQEVDSNQDQFVDQKELTHLVTTPPQTHVYLRWPAIELAPAEIDASKEMNTTGGKPASASVEVHVLIDQRIDQPKSAWRARTAGDGGLLTCGDCSLTVATIDGFTPSGKQLWRQQITQALQNPQFKIFLLSRLELQPDAFDVLDADQDRKLSDAEFERAWRWLSVRQSARVTAQWGLSSQPAFQLFDADGDQRLSRPEITAISARLSELDRNEDGSIVPNELPLVVSLTASRTDRRLQELPPRGSIDSPIVDADWFSAMDVNRDALVGSGEFLGEPGDFERMDSNSDGFLSRPESAAAVLGEEKTGF